MLKAKIMGAALVSGALIFGLYTNCGELGSVNSDSLNTSEEDILKVANGLSPSVTTAVDLNFTRSYNHPMDRGESVYAYPQTAEIYKRFPALKNDSKFNLEHKSLLAQFNRPIYSRSGSVGAKLRRNLANLKMDHYARWGIARVFFQVSDTVAHKKYWNQLWQALDRKAAKEVPQAGVIYTVTTNEMSDAVAINSEKLLQSLLFPYANAAGVESCMGANCAGKNPNTGMVLCYADQPIPLPKCNANDPEQVVYRRSKCGIDTDGVATKEVNSDQLYSYELYQSKTYSITSANFVYVRERTVEANESADLKKQRDARYTAAYGAPGWKIDNPNSLCEYSDTLKKKVLDVKVYKRIRYSNSRCEVAVNGDGKIPDYAGAKIEEIMSYYNPDGTVSITANDYFGTPVDGTSIREILRNECKSLDDVQLKAQNLLIKHCVDSKGDCNDAFAGSEDLEDSAYWIAPSDAF